MYGLNDIMIWVLVEERIVEFIGVYGVFSKVVSLFLALLGIDWNKNKAYSCVKYSKHFNSFMELNNLLGWV